MKPVTASFPVRSALAVAAVLAALVPALPVPAVAQEKPDFLFGTPRLTVGLKGGYALAAAGSDIFDFVENELTVDRSDFRGIALGLEMGVRLTDRLDLALDLTYTGSETRSEFRDWVDMDDRPIEQTTRFSRTPLTLSLKGYLWDRGRSIGRFAWIPRAWTPYAGVGGGVVWYTFEQEGDFVNYETLAIFEDEFTSKGTARTVHALAGVEVSLSPRFLLTTEARYSWAETELGTDFRSFEPIDLSGFQLTIGISGRFARSGG